MRRFWAYAVLFFLVASFMPVLASAEVPPERAAIDPYILEQMAASPDGRAGFFVRFHDRADLSAAYGIADWEVRGRFVYDTLQATAARSQARVRSWLEARGIDYQVLVAGNALFVTAGRAVLKELAAFSEVAELGGNRTYQISPVTAAGTEASAPEAIAWGVQQIGADQVWNDFGVKGQGVVVAGMTTGAEYTHDALFVNYRCGAGPHDDCWADPDSYCPGYPCDVNGHGTHTMGTSVGDDDPALTWNAGVAPDAQWIYCRACSDMGGCSTYALETCGDWFLAPNGNPDNRPHVVNASWGSAGCNTWYQPYVQAWVAAGIFPAFSPGAGGPSCGTVGSPADYAESFATGGTDQYDIVTSFSSRGPSCWGEIKPEAVAPAVNICSAVPGNGWSCGYSGSSMSNSHTAGLVALLWSAAPGLTGHISFTRQIITSTALCIEDLTCGGDPCPGGNNVAGWGRIDAYTAVSMVLQLGWWPGPSDEPFEYNRFDGVFNPADGLIYFPGGRTGATTHDPSIWTYDPLNDIWNDTGCEMIHNAANITAILLEADGTGRGEAIYVVGGYDVVDAVNIDMVQRYYPSQPGCVVEQVSTDPYPDQSPAGHVVGSGGVGMVDGKIYLFGGWENITPYFSDRTWAFDPLAPAGYRWTEITTASLNPARSYLQVAVQGGLIYAMGGVDDYTGTDLIVVDTVEVFDPANPGAGWQPLASMPVAGGEGRGFGFDVDTLGLQAPWAGKLYVAGVADWPDPSNLVMEYDIASDTWDQAFPDLITARRDHAGVFVPICTEDPNDGLPGMWVFGGYVTGDDPPFGDPEYYPFPCPEGGPPVAGFTANPMEGCEPLEVQFIDQSEGDPPIYAWFWEFGDGATSTETNPLHTYAAGGPYEAWLTVENLSGTDSVSDTITVYPLPQASFDYAPPTGPPPLTVHFTNTSLHAISPTWDFGDGFGDAGDLVQHTYTTTGTYTATLYVDSPWYCGYDVATGVVVVSEQCQPVEIFDVGADVAFCAAHFWADLGGTPPFLYDWDFGPFGQSTETTPLIDFGHSGTYPYTLTVHNCGNQYTDMVSDTVTVSCLPPCQPLGTVDAIPESPGLKRASWGSIDLQVINRAPDTQPFTAQFLAPNGEEVYQFSDTLPGGASRYYYTLTEVLPPGFNGTVVLDSLDAAIEVVHLEDPPESGGNTTFQGVDDLYLGDTAYTPIDRCTRLYVHNLSPDVAANGSIYIISFDGIPVEVVAFTIPPSGLIVVDPVEELGLPLGFRGSAVLEADQPVEMTVRDNCGGLASFVAPFRCSERLYAPWVPTRQFYVVSTTISILNPTSLAASGVISYSAGFTNPFYLGPWQMEVFNSPFYETGGAAVIEADQPLVAVIRTVNSGQASPGLWSYRAIGQEEAGPAAALPALFTGYRGWETLDNLWVMNPSPEKTAEVQIRYVTAPTGTVVWDRTVIEPGQVWRGQLPDLPGERAAAILMEKQGLTLVALAGASYTGPGESRDRQLGYTAEHVPLVYEFVHDPQIISTVVGFDVTFIGQVLGTEPISYLWDFGDGFVGSGQTVMHTYEVSGTYQVVMTATNVLGFGESTVAQTVPVPGEVGPGHWIYLPLVAKGYRP